MKAALLFLLCLIFSLQGRCGDLPPSGDAGLITQWMFKQQFLDAHLPSYGAIKSAEGIAAVDSKGRQYVCVSPYDANLAVLNLLQAGISGGVPMAERWMDWYFAHLSPQSAPDGVPCNHFYSLNGQDETTCVKPGDPFLCDYNDATDSAAATFFSVLWAAYQAGVPAATINSPERRAQVEKLAKVLLKLQQPDGLCRAKSDYPVKYLEDNSEVFAGLCALAHLEQNVFGDAQRSGFYQDAANRVQRGILTELYDPRTRLFRVAKFENNTCPAPNLDIWYPDTQAQLWPLLFGVVTPTDLSCRAVNAAINDHWNGHIRPDWAANPEKVNQGWIEAGHAYAVLLMGETNLVKTYVKAVRSYKFEGASKIPKYKEPFGIDDAGWLLRILAHRG